MLAFEALFTMNAEYEIKFNHPKSHAMAKNLTKNIQQKL
jgi:hypothetical protein